ncbi:MAG: type II toxin-antitoxin system HicA family toxin [Bacteroidales bacterium]|jgi:predicted RNA binding protein YcfA (HicA-like mRNA interferase family)|nr:type II toxin-antitoxin system HicA family toxin [Bacteroidales bacterium]MCR4872533.1 type II toxin-antitoxin system HicA family toxin [Bacteroidales bacterium]
MKYSELEKKLRKAGCYPVENSDHPIWYSPITDKMFKTGHHKSQEVKAGTLSKILKIAGVNL